MLSSPAPSSMPHPSHPALPSPVPAVGAGMRTRRRAGARRCRGSRATWCGSCGVRAGPIARGSATSQPRAWARRLSRSPERQVLDRLCKREWTRSSAAAPQGIFQPVSAPVLGAPSAFYLFLVSITAPPPGPPSSAGAEACVRALEAKLSTSMWEKRRRQVAASKPRGKVRAPALPQQ